MGARDQLPLTRRHWSRRHRNGQVPFESVHLARQINHHGLRAGRLNREPSEVDPSWTSVQDHAIGRRDDLGGRAEDRVWIVNKIDGPIQRPLDGLLQHEITDSSAVGYRSVEEPATFANAHFGQHTDQLIEGWLCLGDLSLAAVDAHDIAVGCVTAYDHNRATKGSFNGREDVEAVNHEHVGGQLLGF
jgi:hypothetical protein